MHAILPFMGLIGIFVFGLEAHANILAQKSSESEMQQICSVYFSTQSDRQFCRSNALNYRSVASCGRSLEKKINRLLCVEKKTPYELMDTCDRYLVDERHLVNCIKHTTKTSVIHKCAEDNSYRPAKIHTCLNFLGMSIEHRDFDFEFSNDADLTCTRKNGESVLLKTIKVRRDANGRLMASYKIDSGFFLTPNESSKWFAIPDSALQDVSRSFAWKLASDQELSEEEGHIFFNRFLLPSIRLDQDTQTVSSCYGSQSDLVNPLLSSPAVLDHNRNHNGNGRGGTPTQGHGPVPVEAAPH